MTLVLVDVTFVLRTFLFQCFQYDKTRSSLYEEEKGISTLMELMQIYREKGVIFTKLCTLLGILALDATCKTVSVLIKKHEYSK